MTYRGSRQAVEVQNARIRRLKTEWLQAHGPCAHCGTWENLEVDHIDPSTKDPTIAMAVNEGRSGRNFWYWNKERREAELAKCQALCEECHKIKTRNERRKEFCVNGHRMTPENILTFPGRPTIRECRECKNAYNREYRRAKRASQKATRDLEWQT